MTVRVGPSSVTGLLLRGLLALWLAVCPVFWASAVSQAAVPASPTAPAAPVEENEKEEEQSAEARTPVEWVAPCRGDRRHARPAEFDSLPPPSHQLNPSASRLSAFAPADPFRNGLGSPFRC